MPLTFSSWQTDLANILVVPATDANYITFQSDIISDAENRIYRDLDLLGTVVRTTGTLLSTTSRNVTLPSSIRIVVVESMNVMTSTAKVPLIRESLEYMDAVWGNSTFQGFPVNYAMVTDQTLVVGPVASSSGYFLEVVGTQRPTPLSSTNTTTYLTQYLPDLFMAASCLYGQGYLKNFGAGGDDPRSAVSWEAVYQDRLKSAATEEARKKAMAEGWTAKSPTPIATPNRV